MRPGAPAGSCLLTQASLVLHNVLYDKNNARCIFLVMFDGCFHIVVQHFPRPSRLGYFEYYSCSTSTASGTGPSTEADAKFSQLAVIGHPRTSSDILELLGLLGLLGLRHSRFSTVELACRFKECKPPISNIFSSDSRLTRHTPSTASHHTYM